MHLYAVVGYKRRGQRGSRPTTTRTAALTKLQRPLTRVPSSRALSESLLKASRSLASVSPSDRRSSAHIRQQVGVAELGQQALETDDVDQLMHDAAAAVAKTLDTSTPRCSNCSRRRGGPSPAGHRAGAVPADRPTPRRPDQRRFRTQRGIDSPLSSRRRTTPRNNWSSR